MEKRLKVWKRLLAVVLCFLLVAGMIPSSAIAAQEKNTASVTSDQIEAKTTTNEAIVTKPMTEQEGQATSSQTDEGKDSVQAKSTEVALQGATSQGELSQEQEVEATVVQGVTNETESAADTAIQADTKNEQATEVTAEEVTAETEEITDTKNLEEIPETDIELNGHYYQVYDNGLTWEAAEQYCESLGGHLATITSKEENDYVYQLVKESGYTSAYFGFTDKDDEGT